MTNLDSVLKSRGIALPTKIHVIKVMVFPIVTYRCDSWTIKKAEHGRMDAFKLALEKTLESPLDYKTKPVNPKGNHPWIFTGRTEAEAPILWPSDAKSRLTGKDPDGGKDGRQEEKGVTEDKWLDGITNSMDTSLSKLGDSEGQGSLVCCSPWDYKESDMT